MVLPPVRVNHSSYFEIRFSPENPVASSVLLKLKTDLNFRLNNMPFGGLCTFLAAFDDFLPDAETGDLLFILRSWYGEKGTAIRSPVTAYLQVADFYPKKELYSAPSKIPPNFPSWYGKKVTKFVSIVDC